MVTYKNSIKNKRKNNRLTLLYFYFNKSVKGNLLLWFIKLTQK